MIQVSYELVAVLYFMHLSMLILICRLWQKWGLALDDARHYRHLYECELQDNQYYESYEDEEEDDDELENWKR